MLGEQLIKLRSSRTQEEISQLIGVSRATYSHYENNRVEPDLTTLKTISKIFHVSVDFLLDNESFQTQVDWKDKESDCVYELGEILKSLRGKLSLREAAKQSGLSYSYISSLENGKHPRTGAPINPTPDILRSLANAYKYSYEELMKVAGYISDEDSNTVYDFDPSMHKLAKKIEELSQDKRQLVESLIDALLEKK